MRKLAQGLRFIWRDPEHRLPRDSAISYRRYQLGARWWPCFIGYVGQWRRPRRLGRFCSDCA